MRTPRSKVRSTDSLCSSSFFRHANLHFVLWRFCYLWFIEPMQLPKGAALGRNRFSGRPNPLQRFLERCRKRGFSALGTNVQACGTHRGLMANRTARGRPWFAGETCDSRDTGTVHRDYSSRRSDHITKISRIGCRAIGRWHSHLRRRS